jgi:hypothetical protein
MSLSEYFVGDARLFADFRRMTPEISPPLAA